MNLTFRLVDNRGFEHLVDRDIYVEFTRQRKHLRSSATGYAYFNRLDGQGGTYLHRYVSGAKKGEIVDHINRDVRDNRRKNLHVGTTSENHRNKAVRSKTGFKGVVKHGSGFAAYAKNGKVFNLGVYRTAEVAARVWDAYMLSHYVYVPVLNFKDSTAAYVPAPRQRCNGGRSSASSKYKGIRRLARRYGVQITYDGTHHYLGSYSTEVEAARAYDNFLRPKGVPEWKLNFPKRHPEKGRKAAAARRRK